MDYLDDAVQPQCPEDGVVMRTTATAFVCPHCGHLELIPPVERPAEFDGPDLDEGR